LDNPFSGISSKYKEIKDIELQEKEHLAVMKGDSGRILSLPA